MRRVISRGVTLPALMSVRSQSQVGGGGGIGPVEIPKGHHLHASAGQHSPMKTACGRLFNPQVYSELLHACCDHQWLNAIQKEMYTDTEYIAYLQEHGGATKELASISTSSFNDDDFIIKLMEKLKVDVKLSLSLCAMQDSYQRIRHKRDVHHTRVAAGGTDPYAELKAHSNNEFGSQRSF